MKILMIFGHPDMSKSRVSKKWLELANKQDNVTTRVLSEIHNNYQFDVAAEQKMLEAADRVVVVFPTQWYGSPAILKKWLDDVWLAGWAYGKGGDKLKGKEFIVASHGAGPMAAYRVGGSNMNSMDDFLRGWATAANYCGMTYLPGYTLFDVYGIDDAAVAKAGTEMLSFITAKEYRSPNV